ncbi:N-acetylmuramoyl-L-alanine amidase [Nocardioides sp. 1609]|uniref:N-acetylmuramoyl-L-alanine amidase n=1 Tax=Nocardioides sp. 1609 TaxID=2508327 RepID=UPI001FD66737|nr:N-acetylmuramoyl-L-alanine amidase [Nocardioides sp. 1609]
MRLGPSAAAALALSLVVAGCGGDPAGTSEDARPATSQSSSSSPPSSPAPSPAPAAGSDARPLRGRVVVLDPGHQLGNRNFPEQVSRPVPAGGFTKPCNTTGTATDAGYPEATFTWQVSRLLARRLERLGARVVLTRTTNSERRWGPCVDVRGRAGNRIDADLKLSIHADGSYTAGAHGFHVIRPPDRPPWTDDIVRPSRRLALDLRRSLRRSGFPYATYVAGGDGLDVRRDLGSLNLSDVPTVMVELGNMRSSADAPVMTRPAGRARYADALAAAVVRNLR